MITLTFFLLTNFFMCGNYRFSRINNYWVLRIKFYLNFGACLMYPTAVTLIASTKLSYLSDIASLSSH